MACVRSWTGLWWQGVNWLAYQRSFSRASGRRTVVVGSLQFPETKYVLITDQCRFSRRQPTCTRGFDALPIVDRAAFLGAPVQLQSRIIIKSFQETATVGSAYGCGNGENRVVNIDYIPSTVQQAVRGNHASPVGHVNRNHSHFLRIVHDMMTRRDRYSANDRHYSGTGDLFVPDPVSNPGTARSTLLRRAAEEPRPRLPIAMIESDPRTTLDTAGFCAAPLIPPDKIELLPDATWDRRRGFGNAQGFDPRRQVVEVSAGAGVGWAKSINSSHSGCAKRQKNKPYPASTQKRTAEFDSRCFVISRG